MAEPVEIGSTTSLTQLLKVEPDLEPDAIRERAHEWTTRNPTVRSQLAAVEQLLEKGEEQSEVVDCVVVEAWHALLNPRLWLGTQASQVVARQYLDNAALKEIRNKAHHRRNRKAKSVAEINKKWHGIQDDVACSK
ncbi:MAG: hypothetical protein Q9170_003766 [Blastenia crenularia]